MIYEYFVDWHDNSFYKAFVSLQIKIHYWSFTTITINFISVKVFDTYCMDISRLDKWANNSNNHNNKMNLPLLYFFQNDGNTLWCSFMSDNSWDSTQSWINLFTHTFHWKYNNINKTCWIRGWKCAVMCVIGHCIISITQYYFNTNIIIIMLY